MKKLITSFFAVAFSFGFCFAQSSVWEVSKNGNTLYLGGSVHLLRTEDFPLPKEFDTAFEKSEMLIFETDIEQLSNPAIAQKMMANAMLPEDQTLQTVLNEEVYKQLDAKCKEIGLPIANVQKLKPAMLINILTIMRMQQLGFIPQGLDTHYHSKAKETKKEIEFLETIDFQLNLITSMGIGYENEFVQYSLDDLENIEKEISVLIKEWKDGASEQLKTQISEMKEKFPTVYQSMLINRNNEWLPKIEAYLTNKKVEFIVVGLAHMHGTDGLLEQLKNKGYQITQVK